MKTHRALPLLVLFLQALALAQDNPLTPLRQDPKVERIGLGDVVFKQTRESVWTAVAEAMTSYNWRPQTMDSASGVVFFRDDGKWGSAWGSNNALVARFTTKKVGRMSTWQSLVLETNLIVKTLEPQHVEVRISVKFAGCNGWQAAFNRYRSCKWEPLETNGNLEQELFERISSKLTELSQSELYPATKPDDKVISVARDQVLLFEKIAAAFQLNAPSDRITAQLVDAKASLQTFTDSQESLVLPHFATALNKAAQQFATALSAKLDDRAPALKGAMDSFAEGKKCFSNYQKFVQEVDPHIASQSPSETPTVPINTAAPISVQRSSALAQGQESQQVTSRQNVIPDANILARIGIQAIEWSEGGQGGVQITKVTTGSTAESSGLHPRDVIQSLDGKPVRTPLELATELAKHSPGSQVKVKSMFRSTAMGWVSRETIVTLQQ
jgi:hypothetical protein